MKTVTQINITSFHDIFANYLMNFMHQSSPIGEHIHDGQFLSIMTRFVDMMDPVRQRAMQNMLRFGNDVLIKIDYIFWLFS